MFKNVVSVFVVGVFTLLSVGCATIHRMDSTKLGIIPISQMLENPSQLQDVGKYINEGKTVVFKVTQGQRIPLKLAIDIPIGKVDKSENTFAFDRDVYLSLSRTRFEISPDGQRWTSMGNMASMKKLFGFKKGQMNVGFQFTKDNGTFISLDVSAK